MPTPETTAEAEAADLWHARRMFRRSIEHRDRFVGGFLNQALRQAHITFVLSVLFMSLGGVLILAAGALALKLMNADPELPGLTPPAELPPTPETS